MAPLLLMPNCHLTLPHTIMAAKKTAKKATKTTAKKAAKKVTKKVTKKAASKQAPAKKTAKAAPSIDEITRVAYAIYQQRIASGTPGDSRSDWLEAEKQLGLIR